MRTESWCGHEIRFVELDGEWWAILEDIRKSLGIGSYVVNGLNDECLKEIEIDGHWKLAINEIGVYQTMFMSNKIDARKFRRWSATVMQKLRTKVGLEQYEVMRMLEKEIQTDIDHILDTLFWDDGTKTVVKAKGEPFDPEKKETKKTVDKGIDCSTCKNSELSVSPYDDPLHPCNHCHGGSNYVNKTDAEKKLCLYCKHARERIDMHPCDVCVNDGSHPNWEKKDD